MCATNVSLNYFYYFCLFWLRGCAHACLQEQQSLSFKPQTAEDEFGTEPAIFIIDYCLNTKYVFQFIKLDFKVKKKLNDTFYVRVLV